MRRFAHLALPLLVACASGGDAPNESLPTDADLDGMAKAIVDRYPEHHDATCPGQAIALSCGNFTCDKLGGESKTNCPADCAPHKVGAYNNLPICEDVQSVATPTSTQEVQAVVRGAVASGRRVRVIGARHSASGAICGDGVALSTEKLARLEDVTLEGNVVFTPPGVKMKDLGRWLRARGRSLGYTPLGFNGVTVVGATGTSAHGSSPIHTNSVSSRVVALDVVGPDGALRHYDRASTPDTIFRALQTSLGFLGVITRMGLSTEPEFNLDTTVDFLPDDALFAEGGALGLVHGCDWGQMNWFPGQHKVVRWCGRATDAPADPRAHNVLLDPGVPSDLVPTAKSLFHAGTCNTATACFMEQVRAQGLVSSPPIVTTDAKGTDVHTTHAIGPSAEMMSASLIDLGKNVYFQMDWEVAVPQRFIQPALELARRVFAGRHVCLPGVGAFLRFGLVEDGGWLAYHGAGGDFHVGDTALFFETPVTVPAGYSQAELDEYLGVYRDLILTLIERFGARAHWGKNLDAIFQREAALGTYAGRIDKFNEAVATLDPYGVFANDYGRMIGVRWPHDGEDFAAAYGTKGCACGVEAKPVCERRTQTDYASPCRATCAGKDAADLLDGTCDRYRFVTVAGVHMAFHDDAATPTSTWN